MGRGKQRALLLGWRGGAAQALLELLGKHAAARQIVRSLDLLLLVDASAEPRRVPRLPALELLPPTEIRNGLDLASLVATHRVDTVIDLAMIDTLECIEAVAGLGANTLTTSLERWPWATTDTISGERTLMHARELIPGRRRQVAGSHLIGSGMNPGVVNALVDAAIDRFAAIVGVAPIAEALDLHAILFTEEDTTEVGVPIADDVFPMTWQPLHCLLELHEPEASYVVDTKIATLGHPPHGALYRARCGSSLIDGMVVPHDEVVLTGHRFPDVEVAYVYQLPAAARRALAHHPDWGPHDFRLQPLYPHHFVGTLRGHDRVGVLLCSRRHGELWMGFQTDFGQAAAFATNPTELQVAAGVLAGWHAIGRIDGIHTVDDLDGRSFLDIVGAVLGPPTVVHDPSALPRSVIDRLVQ